MDVVTLAAARHYTNKKIGEMGAGGAMEKLVDLTLTEAAVVTITQTDDGTPLNLGDFDVILTIPPVGSVSSLYIAPHKDGWKGFVGKAQASGITTTAVKYRIGNNGNYEVHYETACRTGSTSGASVTRAWPADETTEFTGRNRCTFMYIGLVSGLEALPAGTNIKVYGKQVSA